MIKDDEEAKKMGVSLCSYCQHYEGTYVPGYGYMCWECMEAMINHRPAHD